MVNFFSLPFLENQDDKDALLTESSSGEALLKNGSHDHGVSSSGSSPPRPQLQPHTTALPLSMQLLQYAPGMRYCPNCNSRHNEESTGGENGTLALTEYDFPALRRSAASPLVVAPMLQQPTTPHHQSVTERVLMDYLAACQLYNCIPNGGVLTALRFNLPSWRVSGAFYDVDMLALSEVLLLHGSTALRYIRRLDFSIASKEGKLHGRAGFKSHGALALSKAMSACPMLQQVYCQRHRIGPYGASALFIACSHHTSIQKLVLRRCRVGERGALAFCEFIALNPTCTLNEVDLSANYIGFKGSLAIEKALVERAAKDLTPMTVDLEGNLVLQEVMNGVTHGLGVLLAFLGSYLLSYRVQDRGHRHTLSCAVYSTSLVVLYVSSTLFHSFFTMQHTKYIFAVFDKCAIYILIAGSYTPFLQVVLWHEPMYSIGLLAFIWVCSFFGICVEAFLPAWKHKNLFSLAMYLGLGWSAVVCLPEVARVLPEGAMNLMILGGVGYTAGVPFFVRDNNLDHAVWHLFVLGGSIFHWCGIYFYVTQLP